MKHNFATIKTVLISLLLVLAICCLAVTVALSYSEQIAKAEEQVAEAEQPVISADQLPQQDSSSDNQVAPIAAITATNVTQFNSYWTNTAYDQITLGANIALDSALTLTRTLTIELNNFNLTVGTYTINVNSGGSLTIQDSAATKTARNVSAFAAGATVRSNISITGGVVVGGDAPVVQANSGGKLFLKSGTVAGAQSTNGAVRIMGGQYTMSGGAISYNRSTDSTAALGMASGGTITITAGTISYNTAVRNGGGVYLNDGTFTMSGGTITGNRAGTYGGGIYAATAGTKIIMSGGTVSGNAATSAGSDVYYNNAGGKFTLSGTASCNITLGADLTLDAGQAIGGTVTIDLNNHNLDVGTKVFTVNDGGSLTIQDTAATKTARNVSAFAVGATTRSNISITGGVVVGGDARIIYVNEGGKLFLKSGTIAGAKTESGAITIAGEFTMSGGTISNNISTSSTAAVGITGTTGGKVTMTGGTITKNTATGHGGGVYINSGTLNMSGSATITGNQAGSNAGGVYVANANGTFNMSGGTISGNTATNGGGVNVNGGTFTMSGTAKINGTNKATLGGGVYVGNATFKMSAGTISGNTATTGAGVYLGNANGKMVLSGTATCDVMLGANVTLDEKSTIGGTVTIDLNNFTLNIGTNTFTVSDGGSLTVQDTAATKTARKIKAFAAGATERSDISINGGVLVGGDAPAIVAGDGAKVFLKSGTIAGFQPSNGTVRILGGTFTMSGGAVSYNRSTISTAAVGLGTTDSSTFIMTGGTISYNTATENAGGVYISHGTFNMSGSATITGNRAGVNGGGIYMASTDCTLNMSGGTISGNIATSNGGGVYVSNGLLNISGSAKINGSNNAVLGGGVYIKNGTFKMSAGTISGNTATKSGPNVYLGSANSKIVLSGTATCDVMLGANVTLDEKSTIGGTVTIDLNNFNLNIGDNTITVDDKGSLTIQDTAATKSARNVSAFAVGATDRSNISITGGVVVGGDTRIIYVNEGGKLFLKSGTIAGAKTSSGAVTIVGEFTMSGGTISNNISTSSTAAVGLTGTPGGKFTMTGGTITNNTATGYGGAVYINSGTLNMSGSATITGNQAGNRAGGVYVANANGTFNMSGGTISNNSAPNGGGVFVNGGTFTMSGSAKINGTNKATLGGAVYVGASGTFTMSAGTISGNTATTNGGGVYVVKGATINLSGAPVIKDNKKGTANENIYLPSGAFFKITGAITSAANSIGITADSDRVITNSGTVASTTGFFTDVSTKCLGINSGDMQIGTHSVTSWGYNNEKHWRECKNCGVTANETEHGWSWSESEEQHTANCSANCGVESKSHEALNPNEWTESSEKGHSGKCAAEGCTLTITKEHTYGESWDQEAYYHSQTCTAEGCQYKKTEAHFIEVEYEDVGDGVHHRGVCVTCQMRDAQAEHTPDLSAKPEGNQYKHWFTCTICQGNAEINHDWTTKPYVTDGSGKHWQYCAECEFKYNETEHIKTMTPKVDATCQKAGTKEYYTCVICKFNFEDESLTNKIEDLNNWLTSGGGVIAKNESAHVWSAWQYDTVRGEHYKECTVCYERTGTAVHTMQKMAGTPATCTENGTHDYYYCRVCRSAFEDESGSKVIGDEDALDEWLTNGKGKIEAGHKLNEKGVCTVCGDYSKWLEDLRDMAGQLEDPKRSELEEELDKLDPNSPSYDPDIEDPTGELEDLEQEIEEALEEENPGLAEEKQEAIEQLEEEASKKNKEFADDPDLSDEQKKELQEKVNKELEKAKRNVELATDSDGVTEALEQGQEAINGIEADDVKPEDGHTHKWSEDWSVDEHGHWHACEGCDERKGYEAHSLTKESKNITSNGSESHSGECVCGTTISEKHVADGSTYQDNHDVSGHWHVCEICDAHIDVVAHEWSDSWTAAKENHYQECKECGQRYEQEHELTDMAEQPAQCEFFGEGTPGVKAYSVCETCGMYFDADGNEIGNRQAFEDWMNKSGKIEPKHSFDDNGICTKCGDYSKALEDMRSKVEQLPEGPEKEELEDELNKVDPTSPDYEEDEVPDDIGGALDDLNGKINDQINDNNEGLKDAKDEAKGEIQTKAEEERNKVDQDDTLSDEAKAAKKAEIDKEEQKVLDDIDNATSIEEVEKKKQEGLESVGKAADNYVPDESHTHTWSDTPSSDATGHWYECEECGEHKGYEKHIVTSESAGLKANGNETHTGECTVCGRSVTQSHVSDGTTYQQNHNDSGHWLVCAVCGAKFDVIEHNWNGSWTQADDYHYQECEVCGEQHKENHSVTYWEDAKDGNNHKGQCVCGKEIQQEHTLTKLKQDLQGKYYQECTAEGCEYETEHQDLSETHVHEYNVRKSDEAGHWYECNGEDCSSRYDFQPHTLSGWTVEEGYHYQLCSECGYKVRNEKHFLVKHAGYEETCNATGLKDYWECTVCKNYFLDADGTDKMLQELDTWLTREGLGVIPKNTAKHQYDQVNWKSNEQGHWYECTICGEKLGSIISHEEVANWTDNGDGRHYKTCKDCDYVTRYEAHSGSDWQTDGNQTHTGTCLDCSATVTAKHDWNDKLTFDDNVHYYECKVTGCTERKSEAAHVGSNWQHVGNSTYHEGICECGYAHVKQDHTMTWKEFGGSYRQECTVCTYADDSSVTDHVFTKWEYVDKDTHQSYCDIQGHEDVQTSAHNFVTKSNTFEHWQVCADCGYEKEDSRALHVLESATSNGTESHTGTCSVCNQEVSQSHVYADEYAHDENGHWHECSVCGNRKDEAEHSVSDWTTNGQDNHTGVCDECGESITHDHRILFGSCLDCGDKLGQYATKDDELGVAAVAIVAQVFALIAVAAIISRRMKR